MVTHSVHYSPHVWRGLLEARILKGKEITPNPATMRFIAHNLALSESSRSVRLPGGERSWREKNQHESGKKDPGKAERMVFCSR